MVLIAVMTLLLLVIRIWSPAPLDWTITLDTRDKIPFGTFVLDNLINDLFPGKVVSKSYLTLYEQRDALEPNQFILSTNYYPDQEDQNVLLEHVADGGTAFISAHYFTANFQDTLGFEVGDYLFNEEIIQNLTASDSASVNFVNPFLPTTEFRYQRNNIVRRFIKIDTAKAAIIAENDLGQPVSISQPFGKGKFILNTTPLAFSNLYLLEGNNNGFVEGMLSQMPLEDLHWAEYYMQGRRESLTPLRYIFSEPALEWAYYILLAALILYMTIESKRKQRVIPVISPLKNSTLDFIKTISSLYFKKRDHRSIANKRINYFIDKMNQNLYIPQHLEGMALYQKIAAKTGKEVEDVRDIMELVMQVRLKPSITEEELKRLNQKIDEFNF